jgi:hypothetical protein
MGRDKRDGRDRREEDRRTGETGRTRGMGGTGRDGKDGKKTGNKRDRRWEERAGVTEKQYPGQLQDVKVPDPRVPKINLHRGPRQ